MPVRSYRRWKAGDQGRIDRDGKARLANLMGIHKALRIIFSEPARGYRWIKATNDAFGGRSALEIMLGGEPTDLMRVRRYLDSTRGGWCSIPPPSRRTRSPGRDLGGSSAAARTSGG